MKSHFCAIANQRTGEDLIGTAGHHQTYVLIECPLPWAAKAFDSEHIPLALRQYIKAVMSQRSVKFLAINRGISASSGSVALMIYESTVPSGAPRSSEKIAAGYRGYEFQLDNLTQVINCLQAYWQGDRVGKAIAGRDILICTHGMRDKCCARFGQPFFRDATQSAQRGELPHTRLWKVSHIGGHRFAPTAISMPDGRYYGRLTLSALQAMVTRKGAISQLRSVYRGWGRLPKPLQVLERQLMFQQGWSWLDCNMTYQILSDESSQQPSRHQSGSPAKDSSPAEVLVEVSITSAVASTENLTKTNQPSVQSVTYRAKLVQDLQKTVCVKPSCDSAVTTPAIKYTVSECILVECPQSLSDCFT